MFNSTFQKKGPCEQMTQTKIFGHRGSMGTSPENTLLGFTHAIEMGVEGIECDVQLTKDGELIVVHDETIDRTTDGTGFIKDLTLKELKAFSAGSKFSSFEQFDENRWSKEKIPTLEEVLQLIAPYNIELNIELKTTLFPYEGIEEKVLGTVKQFNYSDKVIYSSFHLPSLLRLKRLDPEAKIAWLLMYRLSRPMEYVSSLQLEGLHLHKDLLLRGHYDPPVEHLGYSIRVWTVNQEQEIAQLLNMAHVETIMTDFPQVAIAFRAMC